MDITYHVANTWRPTKKSPPTLYVRSKEKVSRAGVYSSFSNLLVEKLPINVISEVGKAHCVFEEKYDKQRRLFVINHEREESIDAFVIMADLAAMQRKPIVLSKTGMIELLREYGNSIGKASKTKLIF